MHELSESGVKDVSQLSIHLAQDIVVLVLLQILEVFVNLHHLNSLLVILHLDKVVDPNHSVLDDFL